MAIELADSTQMLRDLVSACSVSSLDSQQDHSNRQVAAHLANWLEDLGFDIQWQTVANSGIQAGKVNMIAKRGTGDGGFAFAGHTDTVPFDADRWHSDPLQLRQHEDRLYGLGATDMKGFFVPVLQAIRDLPRHKNHAPIYVVASCDEETTMSGARLIEQSGILQARNVVIGEPTNMAVVRAHKGHLAARVCVHGKSGHSSDPAVGINAIAVMMELMQYLLQQQTQLQSMRDEQFAVPYPTLSLGRIAGGDAVNRICANCELDFDLRVLPGTNAEQLLQQWRQQIRKIVEANKASMDMSLLWPDVPAFSTAKSSLLVSCLEQMTNQASETANYSTEAPFYSTGGADVVVMGPGSIARAHQPDEYIGLSELVDAHQRYAKLLHHFVVKK